MRTPLGRARWRGAAVGLRPVNRASSAAFLAGHRLSKAVFLAGGPLAESGPWLSREAFAVRERALLVGRVHERSTGGAGHSAAATRNREHMPEHGRQRERGHLRARACPTGSPPQAQGVHTAQNCVRPRAQLRRGPCASHAPTDAAPLCRCRLASQSLAAIVEKAAGLRASCLHSICPFATRTLVYGPLQRRIGLSSYAHSSPARQQDSLPSSAVEGTGSRGKKGCAGSQRGAHTL